MPDNVLKRKLYGNCQVFSLDNIHIFNCSPKKANWYLNKNLATVINHDPLSIQLNFQSAGDGHANDVFYLQQRENICVCCGTHERLTRHHIVPISFRKFFPEDLKDHNAYDILPLCYECHEKYEAAANEFRLVLYKEYNILQENKVICNKALKQITRAANTLINFKDKLPIYKIEEFQNIVDGYLQKNATMEDMKNIVDNGYIETNPLYKSESQQVVEILLKNNDLQNFITRWRKHFVSTLQLRYLPKYWSVDRK